MHEEADFSRSDGEERSGKHNVKELLINRGRGSLCKGSLLRSDTRDQSGTWSGHELINQAVIWTEIKPKLNLVCILLQHCRESCVSGDPHSYLDIMCRISRNTRELFSYRHGGEPSIKCTDREGLLCDLLPCHMVGFSRLIVFPSRALSPKSSCFSHPHTVYFPPLMLRLWSLFMISLLSLSLPNLLVCYRLWLWFILTPVSVLWLARACIAAFSCAAPTLLTGALCPRYQRSQNRHQTFFSCSDVIRHGGYQLRLFVD